jgi:MFS family permease
VASSPFRLLTLHYAAFQLAVAMAGGFVGAYLLKQGFSLPQALCAYAGLLAVRCGLRFVALAVVRRFGYRAALTTGVVLSAAQFAALLGANDAAGLVAWLFVASLAEAFYWPVYHAAVAVLSGRSRGRELGIRTAAGAVAGVVGPLLGGVLLQRYGAAVDFGLAALLTLLSVLPLLALPPIEAGAPPRAAETLRGLDRSALLVFSADGWMTACLGMAWPMALFTILGSAYDAFGLANAAAGLAGAVGGLACGRAIDRGGRGRYLLIVCGALALVFALRSAASWAPTLGVLAHTLGAVTAGLYAPLLMSVVYDRAKDSGAAYRFHFIAEAGWDLGGATGCLAAAATALAAPAASLAILPGALGVVVLHRCVRGHDQRRAAEDAERGRDGSPQAMRQSRTIPRRPKHICNALSATFSCGGAGPPRGVGSWRLRSCASWRSSPARSFSDPSRSSVRRPSR